MAKPYCPERGDVIWLDFVSQAGHEQSGRRPALVLSPKTYNKKTGLALCCPLTTKIKGYPFEVPVPQNHTVTGAILSDQIKNVDWQARHSQFLGKVPGATLLEVLAKLDALLGIS